MDDTNSNHPFEKARDGEKRLADLVPGLPFRDEIFAFGDAQIRPTRSGKHFLLINLHDRTGQRVARWFSPPDDILERLRGAQVVRVSGHVENNPGLYFGEVKLDACEAAPTPEDLSPFQQPLPRDHAAHRARFFELIRSVQNPHCKELLQSVFDLDGDTWKVFEEAPAAKSVHHAYRGGLLEHTGEVASLCDGVCVTLPYLDRDLLVTGALLHDVGKLEELAQGINAGEYTPSGQLIGHVVLGTCTVSKAIDAIKDFPPSLRDEILHLVISHHGVPEYGAAKIPSFPEALILSQCDLMSARIAQCRELLEKQDNNDFSRIYGWDVHSVYLGTMKRMMEKGKEEVDKE